MKTNIHANGIDINEKLKGYIEEKANAFTKLLREETADAAICDIELKRSKHQTGDVCTVACTLEADGKVYRVSKDEPTFEKAIDKVKDDILQSLRADKERSGDLYKKGAGKIKEMIQDEVL